MSLIVLYFLHSTSVLSFDIDVVLTLSILCNFCYKWSHWDYNIITEICTDTYFLGVYAPTTQNHVLCIMGLQYGIYLTLEFSNSKCIHLILLTRIRSWSFRLLLTAPWNLRTLGLQLSEGPETYHMDFWWHANCTSIYRTKRIAFCINYIIYPKAIWISEIFRHMMTQEKKNDFHQKILKPKGIFSLPFLISNEHVMRQNIKLNTKNLADVLETVVSATHVGNVY